MTYIFCGPDNVGKGTQISNLKRYLEENNRLVHVLHYSNIKGDNVRIRSEAYYNQMFEFCKKANELNTDLILDRAHLGESVYSPLYRNYSGDYVFDLEQKYDLEQITLFVFYADPETLIKRDDGLSFSTDLEKKKTEIDAFKRAFEMTHISKKFLINITDKSIEEVWDKLKIFI
jgi:thymidylate kinase